MSAQTPHGAMPLHRHPTRAGLFAQGKAVSHHQVRNRLIICCVMADAKILYLQLIVSNSSGDVVMFFSLIMSWHVPFCLSASVVLTDKSNMRSAHHRLGLARLPVLQETAQLR